jgi:hypothetical protein
MPGGSRRLWPRCAWRGAPAGLVDGRGPQPLRGDHCRRAGGGGGGGGARRRQGRRADRPDPAAGGSPAHRRGGRDSVCAHLRGSSWSSACCWRGRPGSRSGGALACRSSSTRRRRRGRTGPTWKTCAGGSSRGCGTRCARSRRGGRTWAGRACIPPAGACAVGARKFLVAYNIYFDSSDVAMVRAIAREIRAASGGLKGVKAMGCLAHGRAQLSMNITDFEATPISQVYPQGVKTWRGTRWRRRGRGDRPDSRGGL